MPLTVVEAKADTSLRNALGLTALDSFRRSSQGEWGLEQEDEEGIEALLLSCQSK